MAVMRSKDGLQIYADCMCSCGEGIRINIDKDDKDRLNDEGLRVFVSYTSGRFYTDQKSIWNTICNKAKKIWAIITNKDYYYAEVVFTADDWRQFKRYICEVE